MSMRLRACHSPPPVRTPARYMQGELDPRCGSNVLRSISILPIHCRFIIAFSGPRIYNYYIILYRRCIVDISTIFELNVTICFTSQMVVVVTVCKDSRIPGLKGSHLKGTRQQEARHVDPMQHRRSLRDHPHGHAKGPWKTMFTIRKAVVLKRRA